MAPQTVAGPLPILLSRADSNATDTGSVGAGGGGWRQDAKPEDFILEAWSEGFMVGALIIMACITIANMRKKVLLHKLILLEVRTPRKTLRHAESSIFRRLAMLRHGCHRRLDKTSVS